MANPTQCYTVQGQKAKHISRVTNRFQRFISRAQGNKEILSSVKTIQSFLERSISAPNNTTLTETETITLTNAKDIIEEQDTSYWSDLSNMMATLSVGAGGSVMGAGLVDILKLLNVM